MLCLAKKPWSAGTWTWNWLKSMAGIAIVSWVLPPDAAGLAAPLPAAAADLPALLAAAAGLTGAADVTLAGDTPDGPLADEDD